IDTADSPQPFGYGRAQWATGRVDFGKKTASVLSLNGRNVRRSHKKMLDAGNDFMALSGRWRVYQTAYTVHILTDKQGGGKDSAYL
ncbi:hypothetical protein, partial [Treponema endosymbiont of Eucomonympha sp.]|uniref:hypothetical protein n=1 Tax=Treponema endosymbiont of Eucomonympha sp. TaxID=1580831 RepID=UPI001E5E5652